MSSPEGTRAPVYDRIGGGYGAQRRPDPRWDAAIRAAIGDARTVVNVGAGTGSYEPTDRPVVAVEPSPTMIGQRPGHAAPAVRAVAEAIPLRDDAADVALAILTVHHWTDAAAGFVELRRIARRQVVLTWDVRVTNQFWLLRDYLPEITVHEADLVTLDHVVAALTVGAAPAVMVLPVPADCSDGVLGAYWRRPHAYLDPLVRASMSSLSLLDQSVVDAALARLRRDLDDGTWHRANAHLADRAELDLGYRLVVAGT